MESSTKRVQQLLCQLAPAQMEAVARLLEVMIDPVALSLANAPLEDDEINEATSAELDEAHASIVRGEGIPHDIILREFGMTPRR